MVKNKKSAFTLIELIAVLVIMAILALIVTPLVMNIIRKARVAADKRSIDAYGRSIEYAIAGYLLDNGKFPTDVSELTIEYSGNKVECLTTQLNTDSSVYLTGCTVGGRTVDYAYGKSDVHIYTAYSIGDHISYNNVTYYVIEDSDTTSDTVKLLKETPLSTDEISEYGKIGTEDEIINNYSSRYAHDVENQNGYGAVAYYTSETCGNVNGNLVNTGCISQYNMSDVKKIVDAWTKDNIKLGLLESRLITLEEYLSLSEEQTKIGVYPDGNEFEYKAIVPKYDWMYNNSYNYWTMTSLSDDIQVSQINNTGNTQVGVIYGNSALGTIRPVLELLKTANLTKLNS